MLCFVFFQSQREMFLMRKNHVEFKSFAQTLAINKDRGEEYIKVSLKHLTKLYCLQVFVSL